MKIESAMQVLAEILGSREEVLAVISEMLISDCDFTEKQRMEILGEICGSGQHLKGPGGNSDE